MPKNANLLANSKELQNSPFFKLAKSTNKSLLIEEDVVDDIDEDIYTATTSSPSGYTLKAPPPRQLTRQKSSNLPVAVSSLLDLHNAVENAFRIHLSTCSTIEQPAITHKGQSAIYRYPSLIDLSTLSKLVASSGKKNLNSQSLSRLGYLWNDDIGFIISTTRSNDYSIGLEVAIDSPSTSTSPAKGAIAVMRDFTNAKNHWLNQTQFRKQKVLERAQVWVNEQFELWMNQQLDDVTKTPTHKSIPSSSIQSSGLLTPPSTATKAKMKAPMSPTSPTAHSPYPKDFLKSLTSTPTKLLPNLPSKSRPKTPSDALKRMASYNSSQSLLRTAPVKRSRVKSPSPPPKSIKRAKTLNDEDDVFKTPSKPTHTKEAPQSLTMAERKKNLEASIRAKQDLKLKARGDQLYGNDKESHAIKSQEFQRRSRLSRLPAVAEAVYLLFAPNVSSVASSPSASLPTPTSRKRRARPLQEVASVIVKSSKVAMSAAEAVDSLKMLCNLCPDYLFMRVVDKVEYLEMPTSTSNPIVPPSPAQHPLLAATTPSQTSPRKATPPCSPKSPKSPLSGTVFESPSRNRSAMTLRDVRLVIEKELRKL
ncbi:hypothetical protein E3Q23_01700 [Wallemia mellicola]|uniref:DNA replication factor Cdt1 C-terminal domain-containing protein n=1 Tax=Wallemia mellicola TaxID=1708541 RepID=A0A4T0TBB7_9BASI|nr:hypothetical protein E3Q23_01700 [Wallemia mellicola]TIC13717.1 hypothetical protein E3Q14_01249 [Wallemia mellicola]TIC32065.1 hypothetical protein E3Q10_01268 [Wallemia mellicola]TIC59037.1 hypothetical protein E3Q05_00541 [Wallemia mellicola]TIC69207.1 hypothetical protein E3Q01_00583 [Wallemia mellicola]